MKTYLILPVLAVLTITTAQSQSRWNVGLQTGCVTNVSKYSSGDEEANALFNNNQFKSAQMALAFRYRISDKVSLQSGFNFTEIGFNYSISKDYSLLKPWEKNEEMKSGTCMTGIPALVLINTPVNCSNTRFVFGAGFTARFVDNQWKDEQNIAVSSNEGSNARTTMMYSSSETVTPVSAAFTWTMGFEKLLKKGNAISFMFQGNQGLGTLAESTVNYTATDKSYTHTFINRGSYVTFSLAYNFMPFGSRKLLKAGL